MPNLSFDHALDLFSNSLSKSGKSINTIIAYKGDVNQLVKFLRSQLKISTVDAVQTSHVDKFKKYLTKEDYTAKSISRKLNSIKNFFSFLRDEKVIDTDPASEVKHPKYENDLPKVLKPIEYRALRDACRHDSRSTAIVELMLQAGLRIKEIEILKLEHVQPSKLIIETYESHPQREVPLNASASTAINRYLQQNRYESKSKHVFVTKTGRPLLARNIRSLLNRYFSKAGITNAKVNDLRNTFVVFQLMSGVPIDVVSQVVGHKRISTTEKYLQLIEDKKEVKSIKLKEL